MPTIATRRIAYAHGDTTLDGVLAYDRDLDADEQRPAVLVFHGMEGRTDEQVEFARRVVDWGYVGLAVDLFGTAASAAGLERCGELMTAFLQDRAALRTRLLHILDVARSLPEIDETRVAAIGFCFGGLCVLDLARTGTDVQGVASFHGVLTPPDTTTDGTISAKVIVFHGWDDPYAPPDDVTALGRELTTRGADWQIHAYGNTMHAFMAESADNPEAGVQYSRTSARRAWASLSAFLSEVL